MLNAFALLKCPIKCWQKLMQATCLKAINASDLVKAKLC